MASEHSYKITLSNNKTEKSGLDYLLSVDERFLLPTKEGRKQLLNVLNIDSKFSRAFDLFTLPGCSNDQSEIQIADAKNITLIELKTTQKFLPENPKGFFFGATQNELDVAEQLGERYKFCFVSLHQDSLGFKLLSAAELEGLIRAKRTQYKINL